MKNKNPVIQTLKNELFSQMVEYAKEHHFSQSKLAEVLEITQPRVSSIYRRKANEFSLEILIKFCYRLGILVDVVTEDPVVVYEKIANLKH